MRLVALSLSLTLAACGPQPADPATTDDPATTGDATTSTTAVTSTGSSTSIGPTTDITSTTDAPTGSTSGDSATSTSTDTTGAPDSTGGTTGAEPSPCFSECDENEHCTPEARLNAAIAGDTPLGPFKGTFAFANAAIAFSSLGVLYVVPEYQTDICAAGPMLVIELGYHQETGEFDIEAPIAVDDGQGQVVQTTASVHVDSCCEIMWFCDCNSASPYGIEISVAGDGWSLAGTARPNCCRTYSIDEAA
jgi:hypothetical protein